MHGVRMASVAHGRKDAMATASRYLGGGAPHRKQALRRRPLRVSPLGEAPDYERWSKQDLYEEARLAGVEGRSKMTKRELIAALRELQRG